MRSQAQPTSASPTAPGGRGRTSEGQAAGRTPVAPPPESEFDLENAVEGVHHLGVPFGPYAASIQAAAQADAWVAGSRARENFELTPRRSACAEAFGEAASRRPMSVSEDPAVGRFDPQAWIARMEAAGGEVRLGVGDRLDAFSPPMIDGLDNAAVFVRLFTQLAGEGSKARERRQAVIDALRTRRAPALI